MIHHKIAYKRVSIPSLLIREISLSLSSLFWGSGPSTTPNNMKFISFVLHLHNIVACLAGFDGTKANPKEENAVSHNNVRKLSQGGFNSENNTNGKSKNNCEMIVLTEGTLSTNDFSEVWVQVNVTEPFPGKPGDVHIWNTVAYKEENGMMANAGAIRGHSTILPDDVFMYTLDIVLLDRGTIVVQGSGGLTDETISGGEIYSGGAITGGTGDFLGSSGAVVSVAGNSIPIKPLTPWVHDITICTHKKTN